MLIALIFSHLAFADTSLYQKALQENSYPTTSISKGTAEKPSGVLQLSDNFEHLRTRSWSWLFGISLQSYRPEGKILNPLGESQELSSTPNSLMPKISFGSRWKFENFSTASFIELTGAIALAKQKLDIKTADSSGLTADVSSTIFSLRPRYGFQLKKWQLSGLGEYGQILTSVTSNSARVRKSINNQFYGYGLSLQYSLTQTWLADVAFLQRESLTSDDLQKNNFELGTVFLW